MLHQKKRVANRRRQTRHGTLRGEHEGNIVDEGSASWQKQGWAFNSVSVKEQLHEAKRRKNKHVAVENLTSEILKHQKNQNR